MYNEVDLRIPKKEYLLYCILIVISTNTSSELLGERLVDGDEKMDLVLYISICYTQYLRKKGPK